MEAHRVAHTRRHKERTNGPAAARVHPDPRTRGRPHEAAGWVVRPVTERELEPTKEPHLYHRRAVGRVHPLFKPDWPVVHPHHLDPSVVRKGCSSDAVRNDLRRAQRWRGIASRQPLDSGEVAVGDGAVR